MIKKFLCVYTCVPLAGLNNLDMRNFNNIRVYLFVAFFIGILLLVKACVLFQQEIISNESTSIGLWTRCMDIGSGIISFSFGCLCFLFFLNVKTLQDLKSVKTKNKTVLWMLANGMALLMIPATGWYYLFRAMRGDYLPSADSIGIPIAIQSHTVLLFLLPLNVFVLLSLMRSSLPAPMFQPKPCLKGKNKLELWFWDIVIGVLLALAVVVLILLVIDGDHIMIVLMMGFIYLLLSLRAGKVNYQRKIVSEK